MISVLIPISSENLVARETIIKPNLDQQMKSENLDAQTISKFTI